MSESGVGRTAGEQAEVWLRANHRPVLGLAIGPGIALAVVGFLVAAVAPGPAAAAAVAAATGALAAGLIALAAVALRPRLVRRGDQLEVRLTPLGVERVPLELVECLFRGSEPLPATGDEHGQPRYRVGTLVVRLAERAEAWRSRPTFRPWGGWEDGHITIDGRWCEPLTRERVGQIAERLIAAKRQPANGAMIAEP